MPCKYSQTVAVGAALCSLTLASLACIVSITSADWLMRPNGPITIIGTEFTAIAHLAAGGLKICSPQLYVSNAGSGGDDSAAIQAAVNACAARGGGVVYFPPPSSGAYNVCSSGISLVSTEGVGIKFLGAGKGGPPIRVLPGCAAPPNAVFYIDNGGSPAAQRAGKGRTAFQDMRIDGYCLANYNIYVQNDYGLSIKDTVLRNVAPSGGSAVTANLRHVNGVQANVEASVELVNINDRGHSCYSSGTQPNYNLWVSATDGHYNSSALDALTANYFQDSDGGNHFYQSHGWGYPSYWNDGSPSAQPDMRPQYTYKLLGQAQVVGAVADSFTVAGVYLSPINTQDGATMGGTVISGIKCTGIVPPGAHCIVLDANPTVSFRGWIVPGTGSWAGYGIMTVSPKDRSVGYNEAISGQGITSGTVIVNTAGAANTWIVSPSQTVSDTMMTATAVAKNYVIVGNATGGIGSPPIKVNGRLDPSNMIANNQSMPSTAIAFSGTKSVGSCVITIVGGIVTSITGC